MANLPRKLQKVFGGSLSAAGNIAKFGSLAAGSPAYSLDLDLIQTSAWDGAWVPALVNAPDGLASPALEDMNAILFTLTQQIAYVLQKGMPDYLAGEEYFIDDMVKVGGVIYISKTNNNTGHNPPADTNNWKTLQSTLGLGVAQARAWVCFNGVTQSIYSAHNVSSISKTASGCYVLNFASNLPNDLYAFSGSCGTPAGQPWTNGDDNVVVGGVSGRTSTKSTSQLSVFAFDRGDNSPQDSRCVSVVIFGTD